VTPRPFISYAREDLTVASKLYEDLRALGAEPWLDKKNLLGGQNWQAAIRRAVRESTHFIALLSSNSVTKRGFVQKELREAISVLEEFPPDEIFVIPLRLENVEPTHEALKNLHWIDLFPSYDDGLEKLARSLRQPPAVTPTRTEPAPPSRIGRSKASLSRLIAGTAIALVTALFLIVNVISRYVVPRWNDQYNCGQNEHWVGMTPNTVERSFEVTAEQAKHAVFHGELRWSPVINQAKQTTIGKVELEVDGRQYVIYDWNTPATSTHTFDIAISHLLVGTSGRFKIRWRWENGTSGICIVKSDLAFPHA
jgi:TIR domain